MKFVLRISEGVKFWDLSRGLQHRWSELDYYCNRMLICLLILILWVVWKTHEGEAESIVLLIFVLWAGLNCQWLRCAGVGQKVLFRVSWNWIICLLLWLKSSSTRGASRHPAFMVLLMIKGISGRSESKISFCWSRIFRFSFFPWDISPAKWCNLAHVVYL